MAIIKKEFSAIDAAPSVMYVKSDDSSEQATGVTVKMLSGGALPSTIGQGSQTVTSSSSTVQLTTASTSCIYVIITADDANLGTVYIGGSGVSTSTGIPLLGSQNQRINIDDLSKIYLAASINSQVVRYGYVA